MRKKELASFDFSTTVFDANTNTFQSEDIDVGSAMITLLNEIIHISIKNIHTKTSLFLSLFPRKL